MQALSKTPSTCSRGLTASSFAVKTRSPVMPRSRRLSIAVSAEMQPGKGLSELGRQAETMLKRYDYVSAGMGAMCVTGWFVMHGQNPWTALGLTVTSTVIALVVNEVLTENERR